MHTLIYVSLLVLVGADAQAAFVERTVTRVDGVTIEADPADGEYVRELALKLRQADTPMAPDPQRFGVAELRARRDATLQYLAARLALERPTALMPQVFDKFAISAGALYDAMAKGRPEHFALWRNADHMARLQAGQNIPCFTLEGDGVRIEINASFNAPSGTPPEELAGVIARAWDQLVWPVKIGVDSPAADVAASLRALQDFRQSAASAELGAVMTVLHETVESTLVSEFLHSPDRRWFCEGLANWLALEVIRERVGAERARQYYDLDALIAQVGRGTLEELEEWPVGESRGAAHYSTELNQANYVRATWVIRELVARYGPGLISQWLAEIRRTPPDETDLGTVYAAFRKVTGDDLKAGLRPN